MRLVNNLQILGAILIRVVGGTVEEGLFVVTLRHWLTEDKQTMYSLSVCEHFTCVTMATRCRARAKICENYPVLLRFPAVSIT